MTRVVVASPTLSPDGSLVAVGFGDQLALAETSGSASWRVEHEDGLTVAAFSPQGGFLAVLGAERVTVFALGDEAPALAASAPVSPTAAAVVVDDTGAAAVAWSTDGQAQVARLQPGTDRLAAPTVIDDLTPETLACDSRGQTLLVAGTTSTGRSRRLVIRPDETVRELAALDVQESAEVLFPVGATGAAVVNGNSVQVRTDLGGENVTTRTRPDGDAFRTSPDGRRLVWWSASGLGDQRSLTVGAGAASDAAHDWVSTGLPVASEDLAIAVAIADSGDVTIAWGEGRDVVSTARVSADGLASPTVLSRSDD